MPALRPPSTRRALAAVALVLGLGGIGVGGAGGLAGAAPIVRQTDPAPSTEPVPSTEAGAATSAPVDGTGPDETGTMGAAEAEADVAFDAAQAEADADLRAVWMVVGALGIVALALLSMLVLYVRSTKPARSAARRDTLAAKAHARAVRRGRAPADEQAVAAADEDDGWRPVSEVATKASPAAPAAATPAAAVPAIAAEDRRRRRRRDRSAEDTPVVDVAAAPTSAAVLSRDPGKGQEEGVRVIGSAPASTVASGAPARPDAPTPPVTKPRSPRPSKAAPTKGARPTAPAPAGPPPGPAEGDETVRIVPAPASPTPTPGPPPARRAVPTVAATVAPPPRDRPPPKALIDTPPPPKRPRRVDAPAKQLATPDAERVLVRPGQTPVRVPPRPDQGDEVPTGSDGPGDDDG